MLVDQEAIYAPRHGNSRLLLGLKGSLNEYDLNPLRQRSLSARYEKARRGELVAATAVGFVKVGDRYEKDPGRRVQDAITLVFDKIEPLVPANAPGIVPTSGIVSGLWTNYYLNGHTGTLNPVTIYARTLNTTYNLLDNHSGAKQLWLRSGSQWDISNSVSLRSQVYGYEAHRSWFNNEINSFDNSAPNNVSRAADA